jgi:hypothetical protein
MSTRYKIPFPISFFPSFFFFVVYILFIIYKCYFYLHLLAPLLPHQINYPMVNNDIVYVYVLSYISSKFQTFWKRKKVAGLYVLLQNLEIFLIQIHPQYHYLYPHLTNIPYRQVMMTNHIPGPSNFQIQWMTGLSYREKKKALKCYQSTNALLRKLPRFMLNANKFDPKCVPRIELGGTGKSITKWRLKLTAYNRFLYIKIFGTLILAYKQNPKYKKNLRPTWSYSMQGAQVAVATDYMKHRHVLRLRIANGPQFLIKTYTELDKLNWIDSLESSINISSDLDYRKMPQFITLRVRHRRNLRQSDRRPMEETLGWKSREYKEKIGRKNRETIIFQLDDFFFYSFIFFLFFILYK